MAEKKRRATPEVVDHDEQWRAAQASRRETLPEIVVIEQTWSRWKTVTLVGTSLMVGVLLGAGGVLSTSATAPPPATAAPLVIVREITTTPTMTISPSPTLAPSPTMTATPTATLSPSPTATHAPTTTPTPTPPKPVAMAMIKARALNVRAGPGIDHNIIGYAAQGQRYRIVNNNENGSWLRIDFDGLVGWVSAGWVQIDSGVQDLPAWAEP